MHAIGIGIAAISAIGAIGINSTFISPAASSACTAVCFNKKISRLNHAVPINVSYSACSANSTVNAITGYYSAIIVIITGIAAIAGSAACSSYCNITSDTGFYCTVSIKNTISFSSSTCIGLLCPGIYCALCIATSSADRSYADAADRKSNFMRNQNSRFDAICCCSAADTASGTGGIIRVCRIIATLAAGRSYYHIGSIHTFYQTAADAQYKACCQSRAAGTAAADFGDVPLSVSYQFITP